MFEMMFLRLSMPETAATSFAASCKIADY